DEWIGRLVERLIQQEVQGGGWAYSSAYACSFLTAPVTQSLLLARSQGEKVPDAVFERSRRVLEAARRGNGSFSYVVLGRGGRPLHGSAVRAPVCETTLMLLGGGSLQAVQSAVENFFEYWQELEKQRRSAGHGGPYDIAPWYFYFGHRYAAQAIEM